MLSVITYDAETFTLTKKTVTKLQVIPEKLEKLMLDVAFKDSV